MTVDKRDNLRGTHLILYDGQCGLCNRLNRFVLRRDRNARFRFAPLQSVFATEYLQEHGHDARELNTVFVIREYGGENEFLLTRSRAVVFLMRELGWPCRAVAILGILPTPILDLGYRFVARHRYRIFGKYETCQLPEAEHRARFIDIESVCPVDDND